MPTTPKYLTLGDAGHETTVWWSPAQPDRVHVTTDDPRFTDENGSRAGLRIVFSANPRSADYSPANFNRVARALAAHKMPAPAPVPIRRRHLLERDAVIAELAPAAGPAQDAPVDPATFGWSSCPGCRCVVVDLDQHLCAQAG